MGTARGKSSKKSFSKKKKKSYSEVDFPLVAVTVALVLFGLLMVYSASSYENIVTGQQSYSDFIRQGFFAFIGLFIMVFFMTNIDYHRMTLPKTKVLLVVVLALNVAVILFDPVKGARRWLRFGGMSLQPSELAKFTMVLLAANLLKRMEFLTAKKKWLQTFKVFVVMGIFAGIIVVLQKNLSIGAITVLTSLTMMFLSGATFLQMTTYVLIGVSALGVLLWIEPYRVTRFLNFGDPFATAQGAGHQLVQSLFALTSGGVYGRGLGMSRLKAFWLPEAQNDFIFAVVVEELGLLGGLFLMILLFILIFRGFRIAMEAKDSFGRLLAMGITMIFVLQSFINIAVVIGAFPVTGVTLPFISAGGTSLVVNLIAVGVLLNISRQSRRTKY
ncbi:MAG TPA: stage V sporulation protein E [Clostridiaceae bacterium]|nr:stage V sporulation protein E [Clostridiaceae bacterium]